MIRSTLVVLVIMLQCVSGLVILFFKEALSNENMLVQLATSICLNFLPQNVLVHSPQAHV